MLILTHVAHSLSRAPRRAPRFLVSARNFCLAALMPLLLGVGSLVAQQSDVADDVITPSAAPAPSASADGALRLFFVGNSYTASAGGQYEIVPFFIRSTGRTVVADNLVNAGETLQEHWMRNQGLLSPRRKDSLQKSMDAAKTEEERKAIEKKALDAHAKGKGRLDKALSAGFDVVVLQVWFGASDPEKYDFFPSVTNLVGLVRKTNPGAKIVLYMVWSDQKSPGEQAAITANCVKACRDNGLVLAPAGEAYWDAVKAIPGLPFNRTPTDSHPGQAGAYLIGCTIYSAITGKSPVGLPATLEIPTNYDLKETPLKIAPDTALKIQESVWKTMQRIREAYPDIAFSAAADVR